MLAALDAWKIAKTPMYFFCPLVTLVLCLTLFITSPLTPFAVIWLAYRMARYQKDYIILAGQQLQIRQGLWKAPEICLQFNQLKTVTMEQSILGRIANYGDLNLQTTQGRIIRLNYLPQPRQLVQNFQAAAKTAANSPH